MPSPVGYRKIYDKPNVTNHVQQPSCCQSYLQNKYEDQGLSRYLNDQRSGPLYRPLPASTSESETQHYKRSLVLPAIRGTRTDHHSHSSFGHTNLGQLATKSNQKFNSEFTKDANMTSKEILCHPASVPPPMLSILIRWNFDMRARLDSHPRHILPQKANLRGRN